MCDAVAGVGAGVGVASVFQHLLCTVRACSVAPAIKPTGPLQTYLVRRHKAFTAKESEQSKQLSVILPKLDTSPSFSCGRRLLNSPLGNFAYWNCANLPCQSLMNV